MCLGANSVANGRFDPRFDCEVAIFWQVIRIWDSAKWVRDEIIVQGRLSFSLLRAKLSKDYMRIMCCANEKKTVGTVCRNACHVAQVVQFLRLQE